MTANQKTIAEKSVLGQRGINLIERIVLEMGCLWYPTGQVEAGIDGYIEIRDAKTGAATNCIILVQSRATAVQFENETDSGFDYYPNDRDLHYWLFGNAPVILIRSRPTTSEAYWISIKDYFQGGNTQKSNKIHFVKDQHRFDANCRQALIDLAQPADSGLYVSPIPKQEKLYSNLLEVASYADAIYVAETPFRYPLDVAQKLDELGVSPGKEWILKSRKIISFHDLRQSPWTAVCDSGPVWVFDSSNWAQSNHPVCRNEFVQLLNHALGQRLLPGVRYHTRRQFYYFVATADLSDHELTYKSVVRTGRRRVFQAYPDKRDPDKTAYYRHCAFSGQFLRFDGRWYLEINPTYHYTFDGFHTSLYAPELLSGIKRMERNHSVAGQVIMWASYLAPDRDLFSETYDYPFLKFGQLLTFNTEQGLDEREWLKHEEAEDAHEIQASMEELPLLGLTEA